MQSKNPVPITDKSDEDLWILDVFQEDQCVYVYFRIKRDEKLFLKLVCIEV